MEFLKPGQVEQIRRWVAALMAVPEEHRLAVVESVSARIAELYPLVPSNRSATASGEPDGPLTDASGGAQSELQNHAGNTGPEPRTLSVVYPVRQRDGFAEQLITTYEVSRGADDAGDAPAAAPRATDARAPSTPESETRARGSAAPRKSRRKA